MFRIECSFSSFFFQTDQRCLAKKLQPSIFRLAGKVCVNIYRHAIFPGWIFPLCLIFISRSKHQKLYSACMKSLWKNRQVLELPGESNLCLQIMNENEGLPLQCYSSAPFQSGSGGEAKTHRADWSNRRKHDWQSVWLAEQRFAGAEHQKRYQICTQHVGCYLFEVGPDSNNQHLSTWLQISVYSFAWVFCLQSAALKTLNKLNFVEFLTFETD